MVLFLCSLQRNNYCCILVFLTTAKLQLSFEICKRKSTFFIFVLQLATKAAQDATVEKDWQMTLLYVLSYVLRFTYIFLATC